MKFIKLTAISAAVMASTAAFAMEPVIVVDEADAMVYEAEPVAVAYEAEPVAVAYAAEPAKTGIIGKTTGAVRNTTGAIFGGTKTLFNTAIHPASVSAEAGTLGYGANIGYSLNENTELQAGWAGGDAADLFGGDFDVDDVNYEVDSDFSNPYLGVQLRPASNWFTVGAGIIVPDNDIDIRANSENGSYKINNVSYDSADVGTLEGSIEHRNKLAPYATIGFRPNITNNFGLFGELGAAYMGKTDATVTATGTSDNAVAAAKAAETELENKDWLEWMPIVKVGATYRF